MDSITLKNYRCFREEQTARLAPLTLLVGENSTGKTSFLSILRALWDVSFADRAPDFREDPYDLGAFEDITYDRGVSDKEVAESFEAGFTFNPSQPKESVVSFTTTFRERDGVPFPVKRRLVGKDVWIEMNISADWKIHSRLGVGEKQWENASESIIRFHNLGMLFPFAAAHLIFEQEREQDENEIDLSSNNGASPSENDLQKIHKLSSSLRYAWTSDPLNFDPKPFAGAPIRARPKRTYDPVRPTDDPEGEYIPSYLANLYRRNTMEWQTLKDSLEKFGGTSGLFDDISVKSFGKTSGDPFQIQVRKWGNRRKGVERNLIDVGYGVSQALPMLTELLRPDAPQMFLLQQPEVHLHPSAQAALGSLFCAVASQGKRLIIETHSDYIIDRVRMDVRDKTTALKPDDVSILYFERGDLDVKIHSIRLDDMGNVLNAPPGYRQFFTDEMMRSVGF